MSDLGRRIRAERERAGLTLQQVADAIGVSKSHLSLLESGKRSLSEAHLRRIESALGVEDGRLLSRWRWEHTPPDVRREMETLAQRERSSRVLAERLRDLARRGRAAESGKAALDELLRTGELRRWIEEHTANVEPPAPLVGRIPVINRVAAGYPREFTDLDYPASVADEYIACPDVADPGAFAARVVGDSMAPDYLEGEIVVFSPAMPTPDGSDCFVRLDRDNETTFKRVFFEQDGEVIRLQPINPRYRSRRVAREAVGGLYAAAYVMRRVRPAR